jgi:hypothetical protein
MKNYFHTLLSAAALLLAVSCSPIDELFSGENGEAQMVSFTIQAGQEQSRAAGDGNTVDQVHYEVWDKSTGKLVISSVSGKNDGQPVDIVDKTATVNIRLVKGLEYEIVFWAHNEQGTGYLIEDGLENIRLKDGVKANKETYDAFYQVLTDYKVSNVVKTVVLKRPFGQLNVGTSSEDWQKAINLDVEIDRSTISVTQVANVFNARTGKIARQDGLTQLTFDLEDVLKETFKVEGTSYHYLGMNYFLADTEKTLHDLTITLNDGDKVINTLRIINTPIQRNWRTNIIGDLLTSKENFRVVVEPGFEDDYNENF